MLMDYARGAHYELVGTRVARSCDYSGGIALELRSRLVELNEKERKRSEVFNPLRPCVECTST